MAVVSYHVTEIHQPMHSFMELTKMIWVVFEHQQNLSSRGRLSSTAWHSLPCRHFLTEQSKANFPVKTKKTQKSVKKNNNNNKINYRQKDNNGNKWNNLVKGPKKDQ